MNFNLPERGVCSVLYLRDTVELREERIDRPTVLYTRLPQISHQRVPKIFTKKSLFFETSDSFTLPEKDSSTDSDSDSKPNGYIVLFRTCSHCTDFLLPISVQDRN